MSTRNARTNYPTRRSANGLALAWILAPGVILGWRLSRLLSERPSVWRRRGLPRLLRIGFIGVSIWWALRTLAELAAFVRGELPEVDLATGLLAVGAAQLVIGISAGLVALPHRWGQLLRGDLPAGEEAAVTHAGWLAAVADALHRIRTQHGRKPGNRRIGVAIPDDHRWWTVRVLDLTRKRPRRWFTPTGSVHAPADPPRILMLGASGHGKTVAIHAQILASLRSGHRAVFIDNKGDLADADVLAAIAEQEGFRVRRWPAEPMNVWNGDAPGVISIAHTLAPPHDYYGSILLLVLNAITKEAGPWRSTDELLTRLRDPAAAVSDRGLLQVLRQKAGFVPAHMHAYATVAAKLDPIARFVDGGPGSWSIDDEDWDLVILSADIGADTRLAVCLTGFLADLNAYRINRRTPTARPLMIAIDEVQVLLNLPQAPDLAWTAEQCRSQHIGLLLATQSVAGLGDAADRLLGAGMDLFIGRLDEPDRIAQFAGTRNTTEQGWQKSAGDFTDVATARTQHTMRIDPNRLRQMPSGIWCIISGGSIGYAAIERPHIFPVQPER